MQYILSEEEYQRYQDALKDAEAARSDEVKMAKYLAARDRVHLAAYHRADNGIAPEIRREIIREAMEVEMRLLETWKRHDPRFYQERLSPIVRRWPDLPVE